METIPNNILEVIKRERNGVAFIHSAFRDFLPGVEAHYEFYKKVILAEGLPLPRVEREFLAMITSEMNICRYCLEHHTKAFELYAPEPTSELRKAALRKLAITLTLEVTKTNTVKTDFIISGFTESEWQHAVMIVSYFNFANRLAHSMALNLEESFHETCK